MESASTVRDTAVAEAQGQWRVRLIPTLSVFSLAVCLGLAWRLGAWKALGEGAAVRPTPPRDEGRLCPHGAPSPAPTDRPLKAPGAAPGGGGPP